MARKFQSVLTGLISIYSRLAQVKLNSTLKRSGTGRLSSSFTTLALNPEIYIQSAPNNSNETYTFMGLGRAKTALKLKYEI